MDTHTATQFTTTHKVKSDNIGTYADFLFPFCMGYILATIWQQSRVGLISQGNTNAAPDFGLSKLKQACDRYGLIKNKKVGTYLHYSLHYVRYL